MAAQTIKAVVLLRVVVQFEWSEDKAFRMDLQSGVFIMLTLEDVMIAYDQMKRDVFMISADMLKGLPAFIPRTVKEVSEKEDRSAGSGRDDRLHLFKIALPIF